MPFTMHEVIDGSAPIASDADPNTTPLPQARDVALPVRPAHAAGRFTVYAIDGTTIDVLPYLREPKTGAWLPLVAAAATAVPGAPAVITAPGLDRDARVFMRTSSNTGVTKLAWRYS